LARVSTERPPDERFDVRSVQLAMNSRPAAPKNASIAEVDNMLARRSKDFRRSTGAD